MYDDTVHLFLPNFQSLSKFHNQWISYCTLILFMQDFLELDEHSCSITEGKMCTNNLSKNFECDPYDLNPLTESCVQNTAEECRKECRIVVNSHIEPSALLSPATPPATAPSDESPCVKVEGISASWSYERERLVLNNISMEVNKVSLWNTFNSAQDLLSVCDMIEWYLSLLYTIIFSLYCL